MTILKWLKKFLVTLFKSALGGIVNSGRKNSGLIRNFPVAIDAVSANQQSFCDFKSFCLIIGNSRSGSTILGSIVDAHPNAIVANETMASQVFWRGLSKSDILGEIIENSSANFKSGRQSEEYQYQIGAAPGSKSAVSVYGDKIWNPATLLLHGDYDLISGLERTLEAKVVLIASIRNPFDTIATMHKRSKAPIEDRIRWFFMHCDALAAIEAKMTKSSFLISYHEQLIDCPDEEISRISRALMLPLDHQHLKNVDRLLYRRPSNSRSSIEWTMAEVDEILERMQRFPFLSVYENHTP